MRVALVTFAVACSQAGCYAPPPIEAPKNPWTGVKRVFEWDLSTPGFARRSHHIENTVVELAHEPEPAAGIAETSRDLLQTEATRVASVAPDAERIAVAELTRRPSSRTVDEVLLDEPERVAHLVDDARTDLPVLLVIAHRPLGEIDDKRHRTDPDDDRPEATMWQRIARRLGL
jgi:hypothetical protein